MRHRRPLNATDVGLDLERVQDRRPPSFIFVQGINPWSMVEHAAAHLGMRPCPLCEGGALPRKHYCLGCDRTALDGEATFPGLAVDEAPDPDWHAVASVYDPGDDLAGGVGKPVKIRRGLARSRKAG